MFSSDNGPTYAGGADSEFFASAGPLRGLKGSLYEGGIRVPLIAKWPGKILPGTTSDYVSAFCDMLPTFAELADSEPPEEVDGLSLVPSLLGKSEPAEARMMYWELRKQQAVREGEWKLVRKFHEKQNLWKSQLLISKSTSLNRTTYQPSVPALPTSDRCGTKHANRIAVRAIPATVWRGMTPPL